VIFFAFQLCVVHLIWFWPSNKFPIFNVFEMNIIWTLIILIYFTSIILIVLIMCCLELFSFYFSTNIFTFGIKTNVQLQHMSVMSVNHYILWFFICLRLRKTNYMKLPCSNRISCWYSCKVKFRLYDIVLSCKLN
jgi:hypothetical protein